MKTCAITGYTGILGSNFIKRNNNIKFIRFKEDLSKKNDIQNFIKKNSFDYFLHFGAIVPTYRVRENFIYAKKVNHYSTINIVKELKKKNENIWFFFSSSSHVYGFSNKKIKETNKIKPINKYGKLKALSEESIHKILKKSKVKFCIGRIFSFTHKNQDKSFFVPSALRGNAKEVNSLRDFIDVRDICSAIRILINKKKTGIFNIASGKKINLLKIISIIKEKRIRKVSNPQNNIFADISKLKSLGWRPKYDIFDILKSFKK
tara:strand:- start:1904 stop:2689 length:786 start_codon:yes stop_codon:yes gene_type:complete